MQIIVTYHNGAVFTDRARDMHTAVPRAQEWAGLVTAREAGRQSSPADHGGFVMTFEQINADAHAGLENMFAEVLRSALEDAACGRDFSEKEARLIKAFNGQSQSAHRLLIKVRELEGMTDADRV